MFLVTIRDGLLTEKFRLVNTNEMIQSVYTRQQLTNARAARAAFGGATFTEGDDLDRPFREGALFDLTMFVGCENLQNEFKTSLKALEKCVF